MNPMLNLNHTIKDSMNSWVTIVYFAPNVFRDIFCGMDDYYWSFETYFLLMSIDNNRHSLRFI